MNDDFEQIGKQLAERGTQPQKRKKPRLVAQNERGLYALNIGKRFKKRPVVRSVSLELHRGEVVGLLGPNGAGKTCLLYTSPSPRD